MGQGIHPTETHYVAHLTFSAVGTIFYVFSKTRCRADDEQMRCMFSHGLGLYLLPASINSKLLDPNFISDIFFKSVTNLSSFRLKKNTYLYLGNTVINRHNIYDGPSDPKIRKT